MIINLDKGKTFCLKKKKNKGNLKIFIRGTKLSRDIFLEIQ